MIPHLTILRPSPTTILYTLSTRSPTPWHHTLTFLLRCILFFTAVLVCLFRAEYVVPMIIPPGWVGIGAWGSVVILWIRGLSWMLVGPVAALAFFVIFRRFHVGELFFFCCFFWGGVCLFVCLFVWFRVSVFVPERKGVRRREKGGGSGGNLGGGNVKRNEFFFIFQVCHSIYVAFIYLSTYSIPSPAGYFSNRPAHSQVTHTHTHSHTYNLHDLFRRIPPKHLLAWNPNSNAIPLIPPPRLHTLHPNGSDPRYIHPRSLSRVWSSVLSRHCGGGGVGCCRSFSCKWFIFSSPFYLLGGGGGEGFTFLCFFLLKKDFKGWGLERNEVCVWRREGGIYAKVWEEEASKTEKRKFQPIHIHAFSPITNPPHHHPSF